MLLNKRMSSSGIFILLFFVAYVWYFFIRKNNNNDDDSPPKKDGLNKAYNQLPNSRLPPIEEPKPSTSSAVSNPVVPPVLPSADQPLMPTPTSPSDVNKYEVVPEVSS